MVMGERDLYSRSLRTTSSRRPEEYPRYSDEREYARHSDEREYARHNDEREYARHSDVRESSRHSDVRESSRQSDVRESSRHSDLRDSRHIDMREDNARLRDDTSYTRESESSKYRRVNKDEKYSSSRSHYQTASRRMSRSRSRSRSPPRSRSRSPPRYSRPERGSPHRETSNKEELGNLILSLAERFPGGKKQSDITSLLVELVKSEKLGDSKSSNVSNYPRREPHDSYDQRNMSSFNDEPIASSLKASETFHKPDIGPEYNRIPDKSSPYAPNIRLGDEWKSSHEKPFHTDQSKINIQTVSVQERGDYIKDSESKIDQHDSNLIKRIESLYQKYQKNVKSLPSETSKSSEQSSHNKTEKKAVTSVLSINDTWPKQSDIAQTIKSISPGFTSRKNSEFSDIQHGYLTQLPTSQNITLSTLGQSQTSQNITPSTLGQPQTAQNSTQSTLPRNLSEPLYSVQTRTYHPYSYQQTSVASYPDETASYGSASQSYQALQSPSYSQAPVNYQPCPPNYQQPQVSYQSQNYSEPVSLTSTDFHSNSYRASQDFPYQPPPNSSPNSKKKKKKSSDFKVTVRNESRYLKPVTLEKVSSLILKESHSQSENKRRQEDVISKSVRDQIDLSEKFNKYPEPKKLKIDTNKSKPIKVLSSHKPRDTKRKIPQETKREGFRRLSSPNNYSIPLRKPDVNKPVVKKILISSESQHHSSVSQHQSSVSQHQSSVSQHQTESKRKATTSTATHETKSKTAELQKNFPKGNKVCRHNIPSSEKNKVSKGCQVNLIVKPTVAVQSSQTSNLETTVQQHSIATLCRFDGDDEKPWLFYYSKNPWRKQIRPTRGATIPLSLGGGFTKAEFIAANEFVLQHTVRNVIEEMIKKVINKEKQERERGINTVQGMLIVSEKCKKKDETLNAVSSVMKENKTLPTKENENTLSVDNKDVVECTLPNKNILMATNTGERLNDGNKDKKMSIEDNNENKAITSTEVDVHTNLPCAKSQKTSHDTKSVDREEAVNLPSLTTKEGQSNLTDDTKTRINQTNEDKSSVSVCGTNEILATFKNETLSVITTECENITNKDKEEHSTVIAAIMLATSNITQKEKLLNEKNTEIIEMDRDENKEIAPMEVDGCSNSVIKIKPPNKTESELSEGVSHINESRHSPEKPNDSHPDSVKEDSSEVCIEESRSQLVGDVRTDKKLQTEVTGEEIASTLTDVDVKYKDNLESSAISTECENIVNKDDKKSSTDVSEILVISNDSTKERLLAEINDEMIAMDSEENKEIPSMEVDDGSNSLTETKPPNKTESELFEGGPDINESQHPPEKTNGSHPIKEDSSEVRVEESSSHLVGNVETDEKLQTEVTGEEISSNLTDVGMKYEDNSETLSVITTECENILNKGNKDEKSSTSIAGILATSNITTKERLLTENNGKMYGDENKEIISVENLVNEKNTEMIGMDTDENKEITPMEANDSSNSLTDTKLLSQAKSECGSNINESEQSENPSDSHAGFVKEDSSEVLVEEPSSHLVDDVETGEEVRSNLTDVGVKYEDNLETLSVISRKCENIVNKDLKSSTDIAEILTTSNDSTKERLLAKRNKEMDSDENKEIPSMETEDCSNSLTDTKPPNETESELSEGGSHINESQQFPKKPNDLYLGSVKEDSSEIWVESSSHLVGDIKTDEKLQTEVTGEEISSNLSDVGVKYEDNLETLSVITRECENIINKGNKDDEKSNTSIAGILATSNITTKERLLTEKNEEMDSDANKEIISTQKEDCSNSVTEAKTSNKAESVLSEGGLHKNESLQSAEKTNDFHPVSAKEGSSEVFIEESSSHLGGDEKLQTNVTGEEINSSLTDVGLKQEDNAETLQKCTDKVIKLLPTTHNIQEPPSVDTLETLQMKLDELCSSIQDASKRNETTSINRDLNSEEAVLREGDISDCVKSVNEIEQIEIINQQNSGESILKDCTAHESNTDSCVQAMDISALPENNKGKDSIEEHSKSTESFSHMLQDGILEGCQPLEFTPICHAEEQETTTKMEKENTSFENETGPEGISCSPAANSGTLKIETD